MAATAESIKADQERERLELRARAMRMRRAREAESSPASRGASGASLTVPQALGAPVDLGNTLMSAFGLGKEEPLGGSAFIQRQLEKVGGAPEVGADLGVAGDVGNLTAFSLMAAMGIVGAGAPGVTAGLTTRTTVKAITAPNPAPSITTGIVQDVARTAARNPVNFWSFETGAGIGAGLAGAEARERWPDSLGAQVFAELLGGLTGGGVPILAKETTKLGVRGSLFVFDHLPLTGAAIRFVRRQVVAITGGGPRGRAQARVERATATPEASLERVGRTDIIEGSNLTPAARAGDQGLLELEASVMNSSEELISARAQNFAAVNDSIRNSLVAQGEEAVPLHTTRDYLESLLDERIRIAAAAVDEKMAALGPTATREDLNRIARVELDAAKTAARRQQRQLFQAIPEDATVPTAASRDMLESHRLELSVAQQGDIPEIATKLLSPTIRNAKGKLVKNPDYLGDVSDVKEMRGLSSRLREEAQSARGDPANRRGNRARIAEDIRASINDDLGNATDGEETMKAVEIAVSFSRDYADRFIKNATVRNLLGTGGAGGPRTVPSLTLETSIGTGPARGPRSAAANDALLEAVRRNDANRAALRAVEQPGQQTLIPAGLADEASMRTHIKEFLLDDYRRVAVNGNRIDPKASQTWLNQNNDILLRYPGLRKQLEAAQRSVGKLIEEERAFDPKVSRAAVFLNSPPGKELDRAINSANPDVAMDELMRLVRKDRTGDAERGLKQAFERLIYNKSILTETDVKGLELFSGGKMTRFLDDPAVRQVLFPRAEVKGKRLIPLFTKTELERIDKVRQTALLFQEQRAAGKASEGIIGDEPAVIISLLTRIAGAQTGRYVANKTGGGTVQTPGFLATQAKKLLDAGVRNSPERLLSDAISSQNDRLFKALFLPQTNMANVRETHTQLHAWVLFTLAEQNAIEKNEESE